MKRIDIVLLLCIVSIICLFMNFGVDDEKYFDLPISTINNKKNKIQVIIRLNYENNKTVLNDCNTIEENILLVEKVRKNNYDFYTRNNLMFIHSINIERFNIDISNYSPFVFIMFDDYFDYIKGKKEIIELSKRNDVKFVSVDTIDELQSSATQNTNDSLETLTIDEIHKLINVDGRNYTGSNIKVGIIDAGIPDNLENFSNGEIKYSKSSSESNHTTLVASLIGGSYGVAPKSELYIHSFETYNDETSTTNEYTLKNSVETLLSKGVNVINICMDTQSYGVMNYYSVYLDHIIWSNLVIIVNSSGNKLSYPPAANNLLVNSIACGLNMISVGSIDADKNISCFSRYDVNSNYTNILMKPTLVAPGEKVIIPNTYATSQSPQSGTSYSTPLVTGTIALLLEEYPNLMVYPEVIISALINGATPLPSQTDHWDEHAGAGLLNYEGAREAIEQSTYSSKTVTLDTNLNNVLLSETIDIAPNEAAEFSFLNLVTHGMITPHNTAMTPSFSRFDVKVYDGNGNEINVIKYGENSNTIVGTITNTHTSTVRYRVKVTIRGNKVSMYDEEIMLMIYYHNSHDYKYTSISDSQHLKTCFCGDEIQESHLHTNKYIKLDNTNHKSYCKCGHSIKEGHVVTNLNLTFCLKCRSSIDAIIPGPLNNIYKTYTTINGSYVLSNGLVVLVEDDIEAYLQGILRFNKCNVNIEIK